MLRNNAAAIVVLFAGSVVATAAFAHPKLVKSDPAGDAVIASPKELRLSFNEELVPKFSGVELKDQKGQKVEIGTIAADPTDKKQLVIQLSKPLAKGLYQVDWHAVAADTHRVQGSYSFTVKQ